jgi:hypothetical protein
VPSSRRRALPLREGRRQTILKREKSLPII